MNKERKNWIDSMKSTRGWNSGIKDCIERATLYSAAYKAGQAKESFITNALDNVHLIGHDTTVHILVSNPYDVLMKECVDTSRVCFINDTSYGEPAVRFVDDEDGFEPSLCEHSGLYNILQSLDELYKKHQSSIGSKPCICDDDIIWAPRVPFTRVPGSYIMPVMCDILSLSVHEFPMSLSKEEVWQAEQCLRDKLITAYTLPYESGDTTLILPMLCKQLKQIDTDGLYKGYKMLQEVHNTYKYLYDTIYYVVNNAEDAGVLSMYIK